MDAGPSAAGSASNRTSSRVRGKGVPGLCRRSRCIFRLTQNSLVNPRKSSSGSTCSMLFRMSSSSIFLPGKTRGGRVAIWLLLKKRRQRPEIFRNRRGGISVNCALYNHSCKIFISEKRSSGNVVSGLSERPKEDNLVRPSNVSFLRPDPDSWLRSNHR